ncbi:hypothetical protein, partial [Klebsiella pneumoniae]|uniref:hypothetical protein n=1 Tax=Klebsiella pneumoniae TaxID=573 RepID=UPI0039681FB0
QDQCIFFEAIGEEGGLKLSKDLAQQFLHLMVENIVESLVSYKTAKDQYTNLKMAAAMLNSAASVVDRTICTSI